jgi:hypothetical protein
MFSLLSPFVLWLAPLLAVPLAIALMGRAQPKTRDFPSLLPVRSSLQRAMKRHRLKNWLQLILRTLAVLCLLLAAAGPVWRGFGGGSVLTPPATAGILLHNGAYARIPLDETATDNSERPSTIANRIATLQRGLDSLTGLAQGRTVIQSLFTSQNEIGYLGGEGMSSGYPARFGDPGEAMRRLIDQLDAEGASQGLDAQQHVYVPVFAKRDLAALASAAIPWMHARPGARVIVLDYSEDVSRLHAFGRMQETFDHNGLMTARLNSAGTHAPVYVPLAPSPGGPRDAALKNGQAEIMVPVAENTVDAAWLAGTIELTESDPARPGFAFTKRPVAYHIPPPSTLCHYGAREAFVSLATLGEGGKRMKVVSLNAALAQPPSSSGMMGRMNAVNTEGCDLLYLADPPDAHAALLARAAGLLRTGGTVILEAGPNTDPVLWNRNLLAPLKVGLLAASVASEPTPVRARIAAVNALGARADRWGNPGTVTARMGFRAEAGTSILLAAESAPGAEPAPIAIHRRIEATGSTRMAAQGQLLLWTTSLSNPAWSDLGLGPWAALLHQALVAGVWSEAVEPQRTETDSLFWIASHSAAEVDVPRIVDPRGETFTRVRAEAGGFTVGPFDEPGLYRIESPRGGWLAVDVAQAPKPPAAADWKAFNETFEQALGPEAATRIHRLRGEEDWRTLYGGVRLRVALIVLAALLLFAEGVVSLRLAHTSKP